MLQSQGADSLKALKLDKKESRAAIKDDAVQACIGYIKKHRHDQRDPIAAIKNEFKEEYNASLHSSLGISAQKVDTWISHAVSFEKARDVLGDILAHCTTNAKLFSDIDAQCKAKTNELENMRIQAGELLHILPQNDVFEKIYSKISNPIKSQSLGLDQLIIDMTDLRDKVTTESKELQDKRELLYLQAREGFKERLETYIQEFETEQNALISGTSAPNAEEMNKKLVQTLRNLATPIPQNEAIDGWCEQLESHIDSFEEQMKHIHNIKPNKTWLSTALEFLTTNTPSLETVNAQHQMHFAKLRIEGLKQGHKEYSEKMTNITALENKLVQHSDTLQKTARLLTHFQKWQAVLSSFHDIESSFYMHQKRAANNSMTKNIAYALMIKIDNLDNLLIPDPKTLSQLQAMTELLKPLLTVNFESNRDIDMSCSGAMLEIMTCEILNAIKQRKDDKSLLNFDDCLTTIFTTFTTFNLLDAQDAQKIKETFAKEEFANIIGKDQYFDPSLGSGNRFIDVLKDLIILLLHKIGFPVDCGLDKDKVIKHEMSSFVQKMTDKLNESKRENKDVQLGI